MYGSIESSLTTPSEKRNACAQNPTKTRVVIVKNRKLGFPVVYSKYKCDIVWPINLIYQLLKQILQYAERRAKINSPFLSFSKTAAVEFMINTPSQEEIQQVYPNINIQSDDPFEDTHQRIKSDHIDFKPIGNPVPERPSSEAKTGQQTDEDKLLVQYKEKPSKKHGFTCPYHPLQIFTILFFAYNILIYYIVITPALLSYSTFQNQQKLMAGILGSVYGILLILVIFYTFQTTIIDPTDITVYLEREAQVRGYDVVNFDVNSYEYFCNVCKTHVLEGSKHCQQCNRCVSHFDHHCPWLNNCIGQQNYSQFIKMLTFVSISLVYQGAIGILAFYISEDFCRYQQSLNKDRWLMLVINMCLQVPVLLSNGKLLSFHIYLKIMGLTTYQYIIKQREEASQQKQKSKVILSKREQDLEHHINVENYNSPRNIEDGDNHKYKNAGKDSSEINQLVNNSPPNTQSLSQASQQRGTESIINESGVTRDNSCSCLNYIREKLNIQSGNVQPRSIKVQPIIHQGSDCIPEIKSMSQLDDIPQISLGNNENMETPTPVDKSRHHHFALNSQLPPMNKKDQLDAIVAATKIRQRTINIDDDSRSKAGKRSSIVQTDELPSDQYRLHDANPRVSEKQLRTINIDGFTSTPIIHIQNDKERQSFSQLAKNSVQAPDYQQSNLKQLLNLHVGTSSRPILINTDSNFHQGSVIISQKMDIKHQQLVDFSVKDIEEASYRKPSRNFDRGTSDLLRNSISSKQVPQNNKNLV